MHKLAAIALTIILAIGGLFVGTAQADAAPAGWTVTKSAAHKGHPYKLVKRCSNGARPVAGYFITKTDAKRSAQHGWANASCKAAKHAAYRAYRKAYTDGCRRDFESGYIAGRFRPSKGIGCQTWQQATPWKMTKREWHRYARSFHAVKIGKVDGHRDCWAKVGPTSRLLCRDGFRTTS